MEVVMKRTFLLTGMLIALWLIAFAPMSAMAWPYEDQLEIVPAPGPDTDEGDIPYFQDTLGRPLEIDFSDSHVHTNSDGSFEVAIYTTANHPRGPYDSGDGQVFPWPNLQEDSVENSTNKIGWIRAGTDGAAWFNLEINPN
jgi:hypothetical protein